ncbi:MAG: sugar transferase [Pseudomonadota bacterium]|nr:sugar transferase [Pseudomonadota bacterium]
MPAFAISLPLLALIAVAVVAVNGRPILFQQVRVGHQGRLFTMYKFRTMREAFSEDGTLLSDEQRVTSIGRVLRRFRLDELPELILVIAGKMSLVGPRPLPPQVLEGLKGGDKRAVMRPGLTGLAQVAGNTQLSIQEKIALDLYYLDNWSLRMDVKILVQTLAMLVLGGSRNEQLIALALAHRGGQSA